MTNELATRRLIVWSARLSDLWEPVGVAQFMLSHQATFAGKRPVDMMANDDDFETFDRQMRLTLPLPQSTPPPLPEWQLIATAPKDGTPGIAPPASSLGERDE